jgi:hypothetical protein
MKKRGRIEEKKRWDRSKSRVEAKTTLLLALVAGVAAVAVVERVARVATNTTFNN